LNEREAEVIRLYFGFTTEDRQPMHLDDIAKRFFLTRERVRQIKDKAVSKLRKHMTKNHSSRTLPIEPETDESLLVA
ncbi:MAG TPA: sigma factor-like helix-turn-helix DNA-binding protein, partial [Blastocatellia bacterium]|nr:sigma factor-like helix-turn-helix DNA-binding protein [Blastocatellia bacterium]